MNSTAKGLPVGRLFVFYYNEVYMNSPDNRSKRLIEQIGANRDQGLADFINGSTFFGSLSPDQKASLVELVQTDRDAALDAKVIKNKFRGATAAELAMLEALKAKLLARLG